MDPAPLGEAVLAARYGNRHTLRDLVDWRLYGAARMIRALHGVDLADRPRIAAGGLAELSTVEPDDPVVVNLLRRLRVAGRIRPATADERAAALAALVADVPVPPNSPGELDRLAAQTRALHEVWVVEDAEVVLAVAPDGEHLVPVS
jgi:hypothetical protein